LRSRLAQCLHSGSGNLLAYGVLWSRSVGFRVKDKFKTKLPGCGHPGPRPFDRRRWRDPEVHERGLRRPCGDRLSLIWYRSPN
jgi:hypothetical protein